MSIRNLTALTGIRFFLALMVVLYHFYPGQDRSNLFSSIIDSGGSAVSFFFILSGFILVYNYATKESFSAREFYQARFARIYPCYALALLIVLPHYLKVEAASGWTGNEANIGVLPVLVANVLLLQAWSPNLYADLNPPGWSLSAEAFFYLTFPLLMIWSVRLRNRSKLVIFVLSLAFMTLISWAMARQSAGSSGPTILYWARMAEYLPLLRVGEFIAGMMLGHLFLAKRHSVKGWQSDLMVAIGFGLALCLIAGPMPVSRHLACVGGLAVPFSLVIWGLASGGGLIGSILSRPLVVLLGEASYGLYILHIPLYLLLNSRIVHHLDKSHMAMGKVVMIVVIICLSVVALKIVEEPARRRLRPRRTGSPTG